MSLIDALSRNIGRLASYLYLACVGTTAYEVVMRYFFNAPTRWAFEVTMMLCATAWLLSGCYVALKRKHISITTVYEMVPPAARRCLDLFAHVVGIVALVALAWAAFGPAIESVRLGERTGTAFNSPMPAIIKPLIVVGSVLYALQLASNLAAFLRGDGERGGRDEH